MRESKGIGGGNRDSAPRNTGLSRKKLTPRCKEFEPPAFSFKEFGLFAE
jgi:hypothetical protein